MEKPRRRFRTRSEIGLITLNNPDKRNVLSRWHSAQLIERWKKPRRRAK